MTASLASWLVIAVAMALANLPFFTEKLFGVIPLNTRGLTPRGQTPDAPVAPRGQTPDAPYAKHPFWRLLELIVLYFVVGLLAWALEARIGNVFPQTWEFYAITACMFIVLAFPGFVLRYLRKRRY